MSNDCCAPPPPIEEDQNPPRIDPAAGETRLLVDRCESLKVTSRQDTDAMTALTRGLREYLSTVAIDVAGAVIRFQTVLEHWAEPNDIALYPGAAVQISGETNYDYAGFTPTIDPRDRASDGQWITRVSELTTSITIEAHCSGAEQRVAVAMLLEAALNPVDWMYGFRLALPHYYNQVGVYEPVRGDFQDNAANARHNLRPFVVTLEARVPVRRPRRLPEFQPKTTTIVVESPTDLDSVTPT